MARLPRGDDPRLLDLIGSAVELLEIEEFRLGLLNALQDAIPADWVALSDISSDPESIVEIIDPPAPENLEAKFRRYAHQNPLIEHYRRAGDGRALRFSDVTTPDELHATAVYQQFYKPMGIEHQIAFTLPSRGRILGVVLARGDPDFSDDERDLLEAARPFLITAYRNAIRYSNLLADRPPGDVPAPAPEIESLLALGLTAHQARVLQLAATGVSEPGIATHLQISRRTVQKHGERIYRALGVHSRQEAIERAWATTQAAVAPRRVHRGGGMNPVP
jgi:DNA-binding CsgD family transcriptional regulator